MSDFGNFLAQRAVDRRRPQMPATPTTQPRMPDMTPVTSGQAVKPIDFSKLEQAQKKGGGGIGDVFAPLGRAALNVLDIIDTPRAAVVSGLKETADWLQGEGFSFDDLISQTSRNIGFQELLDDVGMAGGWQRSVLGFVGDVLTDPTTYFTLGVAPLAGTAGKGLKAAAGAVARDVGQQAADDALRVAIQSGSSRMLSESIARSARAAGLEGSEGVQRLMVEAAQRGRGALTKKGLTRAGVSSDEIAKLGIPQMQRTVGVGRAQVRIPGTTRLIDVTENVKGGIKADLRGRKASQYLRGKFTPDVLGTNNLTKIIYDTTKNMGERAGAVVARSTVQKSLGVGRAWANETRSRVKKSLIQAGWRKLDDASAVAATHSTEAGAAGVLQDAVRKETRQILDDAKKAKVQVNDFGPNYLSHIHTQEYLDLSRKNPEAAKHLTKNINTEEGFQQSRTLVAGSDFLNEFSRDGGPLKYGTIEEINERSMAAWGVKMFEDDVRVIMDAYVTSVGEAIARAKQKELLHSYGLSKDLASQVVREANDDPIYKTLMDNAEKSVQRLRREEKVALSSGREIRRKAIPQAKKIIKTRLKKLADDRLSITKELNNLARKKQNQLGLLQKRQREVTALQDARDVLLKQVSGARKSARAKAKRELVKVEKELDRLVPDWRKVTDLRIELERHFPTTRLIQDYNALLVRENELGKRIGSLNQQAEDLASQFDELRLRQTPAGQGPTPPDLQVRKLNREIEKALLNESKRLESYEAAAAAHAFAVADNEWALQQIDQVIKEQTDALDAIDNVRGDVAARQMDTGMMLKQQMDTAAEVLRRGGDDADSLRLARLEAAAAASDQKAWAAGRQADQMDKMIDATKDNNFLDIVKTKVEPGMVQIGDAQQIPQWLHEALTLPAVTGKSIEINRFMRQFYGLWKGYAILRPGFHVRNFYSGMYNLYLEAGPGAIKSAKKWRKFHKMVERNPGDYMTEARQVFGDETAERLQQAWVAVSATGSGQIAGELSNASLMRASWNPLSERFGPLRGSRRFGEKVENVIRGSHAFDVLERGGTLEQAIDTVNKWQFNYTDLTTWDQNIKLAMPFWTFFSRNIALQAQEWVRTAGRLNRSFVNFDRNVGYGLPEDRDVPAWYKEAGAIQLTGGERAKYLFTDLPAAVWPGQLSDLSTPSGVAQLLGGTAPWIKVPIEGIAGRQLFSGVPIKDEFVPLPVGLRNIPGIEALPFVEQSSSGTPMIEAKNLNALMSFLPGLSSAERLFPGTAAGQSRQGLQWLGQATGITLRENTPETRRGEQYRQLLEQQRQERLRESLG